MHNNTILAKNENEANNFAAHVMLITILFVVLVYLLDFLKIFIVPLTTITIALGSATIFLLIPAVLVFLLKIDHWSIKYIAVSAAVFMTTSLSMFLSYHVVILYIYPMVIASLYFPRRLSWYAVLLSVVLLSASQILGFHSGGVQDKNFSSTADVIIFGVAPRAIELIAGILIIKTFRNFTVLLQHRRNNWHPCSISATR